MEWYFSSFSSQLFLAVTTYIYCPVKVAVELFLWESNAWSWASSCGVALRGSYCIRWSREWEVHPLSQGPFLRLWNHLSVKKLINIICVFRDRLEGWISPHGSPFVRVWIWCYHWCRWPQEHLGRWVNVCYWPY